jgi:hypothetical protein
MVVGRIFQPKITGFFRPDPQNAHSFANIRITIINRDLQCEIRSHKGPNILDMFANNGTNIFEKEKVLFFSIWFENATVGLEPVSSPG